MSMNGRHGNVLDKWLKEFDWLLTRAIRADVLMICNDCLKAGKKNVFKTECQHFQRSALVRYMQQVDHKSTAQVLQQQQHFKAASENASTLREESIFNFQCLHSTLHDQKP